MDSARLGVFSYVCVCVCCVYAYLRTYVCVCVFILYERIRTTHDIYLTYTTLYTRTQTCVLYIYTYAYIRITHKNIYMIDRNRHSSRSASPHTLRTDYDM
jgi:hypothetical protein